MEKKYLYSLFLGLFLIFQLQVLSYLNWLMVTQGTINGVQDKYLLLKTPLIMIPILLIIYYMYGIKTIISKKSAAN
ncbi:hypothetical protein [Enterococcus sp. AZ102]|uniref:Uncharacterized protein n=1 Tax=Enterococcus sulfureus ATCC 49903 TaxID=1140003 RepID=S0L4Q8_9ENTE|nr:hypothetical protein OMY_01640 [Enterococcus sulfureus ATCC 49903]EOT86196.1 hypothetical protein I573_00949 [Enterococcus sulfureus ATCC 49903]